MDWKWFFIYPEQGIATVNKIALPVNIPVESKVTSNSTMNSSLIPRLGSQIHAMAGMQARLYLIANEVDTCDGTSASCSGPGFPGMKFKTIVTKDRTGFDQWVAKAKQSTNTVSNMATFERVAAPSEYNQVEYFSDAKPDLFKDVVNKLMAHGESMGMSQPEGEHSAHEGMEGMDTSHAESVH